MIKWRRHKKLLVIAPVLLILIFYATWEYFAEDDFDFDEFFKTGVLKWYNYTSDSLNGPKVSMSDPKLIQKIRERFLIPPPEPTTIGHQYRLKKPRLRDPSMGQGEKVRSILHNKKNGFFIEVGALDGETRSNTLYFERFLNWTGLLIEPDPLNFAKLLRVNRNAWLSPSCVSINSYPEIVRFEQNENIGKIVNTGINDNGLQLPKGVVNVQCFPLYSYLLALNVTTVDYFSLDVEGVELDVLKTIPFNLIDIKTLSVEFVHVPGGKEAMNSFMFEQGIACSSGVPSEEATQLELFSYLTDPCRYDVTTRAPSSPGVPLKVQLRSFIYYLRAYSDLNEMDMTMLLELKWTDPRLKYSQINSNVSSIRGVKKLFAGRMWLPHTYLTNEKTSEVMGNLQTDNLIDISPMGTVLFSGRFKTTLRCKPVNVEWFPFDRQQCELIISSWRYDSSEVRIEWKMEDPVEEADKRLSQVDFYLLGVEATSGLESYVNANEDCQVACKYNHSSLSLTFNFVRQSGFYLVDYYFPSIILVMASWVTFWMAPSATPGRAALGSGTMLTFLLLSWTGSPIPTASQFKVNDIWELSCTAFILMSLWEFALVTTIDRRKPKNVQLKKKSGKYIMKYSVSPKMKPQGRRMMVRRSSSVPSSPEIRRNFLSKYNKPKIKTIKELTDSEFRSKVTRRMQQLISEDKTQSIPMIRLCRPSLIIEEESEDEDKPVEMPPIKRTPPEPVEPKEDLHNFFTMTPQEIARWIDTQSRIVFPAAFVVFNLIYWNFLWIPQSLMN